MPRHEWEKFLFTFEYGTVLAMGWAFTAGLCLLSIWKADKLFPFRKLMVIYAFVALMLYLIPWVIKKYAFGRLTDDENLFFLTSDEVGPSYDVLWSIDDRWSDIHLSFLTGSIFIIPLGLVGIAHITAILIRASFRLFRRYSAN